MEVAKLKVGDKASFQKTISEADVYQFAGITGDLNPAHVNSVIANKSIFKDRVVHGMLLGGLISAVLGMYLPGPGTIYLEQNLKFKKPVFFGDTIEAIVEVKEIIIEKNRIILETICVNQNGIVVLEGYAVVMPPS